MKLLDSAQVKQKVRRLAHQILENNYSQQELILAGINNNGTRFAKLLKTELENIRPIEIQLTTIRLSPADPISSPVSIGIPNDSLKGKHILVVDDVANTGRTLFYALKPLMEIIPSKVEIAVLVDRKHKSFPIQVDYFGMTLATTIQEHIDVRFENKERDAVVFLD